MLLNEAQIRKLVKESLKAVDDTAADDISSRAKEVEAAGIVLPVSDKKLSAVDASFRPVVEKIMGLLKGQGFDPILGSAYRSPKDIQKQKQSTVIM